MANEEFEKIKAEVVDEMVALLKDENSEEWKDTDNWFDFIDKVAKKMKQAEEKTTKTMLENLIGSKLIQIDNNGFTVKKDNEIRTFEFCEDYGDCCGYNDITANLIVSETELANNPVITEVKYTKPIQKPYHDVCDEMIITFMGECKPIAEINSYSSSGSGWCYGAHTWVVCKETSEQEELTSW